MINTPATSLSAMEIVSHIYRVHPFYESSQTHRKIVENLLRTKTFQEGVIRRFGFNDSIYINTLWFSSYYAETKIARATMEALGLSYDDADTVCRVDGVLTDFRIHGCNYEAAIGLANTSKTKTVLGIIYGSMKISEYESVLAGGIPEGQVQGFLLEYDERVKDFSRKCIPWKMDAYIRMLVNSMKAEFESNKLPKGV